MRSGERTVGGGIFFLLEVQYALIITPNIAQGISYCNSNSYAFRSSRSTTARDCMRDGNKEVSSSPHASCDISGSFLFSASFFSSCFLFCFRKTLAVGVIYFVGIIAWRSRRGWLLPLVGLHRNRIELISIYPGNPYLVCLLGCSVNSELSHFSRIRSVERAPAHLPRASDPSVQTVE